MGLDIYLRRFENYADAQRREAEYEARSEAIWKERGGYDSMTDIQRNEVREQTKAIAAELGLDEYGSTTDRLTIENPSRLYPEHLFKVGYFRSSYNEGGFNSVMPSLCGTDLYGIFNRTRDDGYEFQPDWRMVKDNAIAALERARAHIATVGTYRVSAFSNNMFGDASTLPDSSDAAMKVFEKELERSKGSSPSSFEAYSTNGGTFFFAQPMEVVAVIEGRQFNRPASYAIYKVGNADIEWYLQALEIVIETCEWVLDQPDKDKYHLAWSG